MMPLHPWDNLINFTVKTRENFVSLYVQNIALEAKIDILASVVFGLSSLMEEDVENICKETKLTYYDGAGELLERKSRFRNVPEWAKSQYKKDIAHQLKVLHDAMLNVQEGRE